MLVYLTTEDNPWNPFDNWNEWFAYDIEKGYNTCDRLARLAPISDSLPDTINKETIEEAMNMLLKTGAFSKNGEFVNYKKVFKDKNEQKAS